MNWVVFISVGMIFDVRWCFSSFRAIRALWVNFPSLVKHLESCVLDSSRNSKERSKCSGLIKKMSSWCFVAQMAMLKDCLRVVKDLSLYFQRDSANIVDSSNKIELAVKLMRAMKDKNGKSLSAFVSEYRDNNTFKGIFLNEGLNDQANFLCTKKQFFQAMVDSINSRFPEDVLLSSAKVLNVHLWPEDEGERLLFGDKEVAFLAKLTGLNTVDVLIDFRDYKLTKRNISPLIKSLLCRLSVIPISSAACERGFSAMNAQQSATRNRLLMKNLDGILFVSVNGMPLNCWDPKPYVMTWLKSGRHSAADKPVGKGKKKTVVKHSSLLFKST